MTTVYIGLGSNLGDREERLRKAMTLLAAEPGIEVVQVSSLYETAPVGFVDQPPFLNAIAVLSTDLSPDRLLGICQTVEEQLNRRRSVRWGPRTIDIDVLLFDDEQLALPCLTVPHPRMHERLFVLIPLQEVAPDLVWGGKAVSEYISCVGDRQDIQVYAPW